MSSPITHILSPLDPFDIVHRAELGHVDPEAVDIRIGKQVRDPRFLAGIDEMANDWDDRARPSGWFCKGTSLDSFTLAVSHAGDPMRPLTVLVLGLDPRDETLNVTVQLVFTDAEVRGEGLTRLTVAGATIGVERLLDVWDALPGSSGARPEEINVVGEAVSSGGRAVVDRFSDNLRSALTQDDLEPA